MNQYVVHDEAMKWSISETWVFVGDMKNYAHLGQRVCLSLRATDREWCHSALLTKP